jgi:hypothetical protein
MVEKKDSIREEIDFLASGKTRADLAKKQNTNSSKFTKLIKVAVFLVVAYFAYQYWLRVS